MKLPEINVRRFKALLTKLHACPEAVKWARGKSSDEAYRTCRRADWMLWMLVQQIGQPGWMTHQQVVLLACACAKRALKHVPAGGNRPRLAIEAARRWAADSTEVNRAAATTAGNFASWAAWEAYAMAAAAWAPSDAWWAEIAAAAAARPPAAAGVGYAAREHRAMCVAMRKMIRGFGDKAKEAKA